MNAGRARSYRQQARARQALETGERILDAATRLFVEHGYAALTLARVADLAGVSTQTVIRRYGDKEGLVAAAAARSMAQVGAQRDAAPAGDLEGIVDNLLEHYAAEGATALRMLADEDVSAQMVALTAAGRRLHHDWCAHAFAPFLDHLPQPDRRRRLAEVTAICDVQLWQILRRDCGLDPAQLRAALLEMLAPLTARPADQEP